MAICYEVTEDLNNAPHVPDTDLREPTEEAGLSGDGTITHNCNNGPNYNPPDPEVVNEELLDLLHKSKPDNSTVVCNSCNGNVDTGNVRAYQEIEITEITVERGGTLNARMFEPLVIHITSDSTWKRSFVNGVRTTWRKVTRNKTALPNAFEFLDVPHETKPAKATSGIVPNSRNGNADTGNVPTYQKIEFTRITVAEGGTLNLDMPIMIHTTSRSIWRRSFVNRVRTTWRRVTRNKTGLPNTVPKGRALIITDLSGRVRAVSLTRGIFKTSSDGRMHWYATQEEADAAEKPPKRKSRFIRSVRNQLFGMLCQT